MASVVTVAPDQDLKPCQKKALQEFRTRLEEEIATKKLLKHNNGHRHEKNSPRVAHSSSIDDLSTWNISTTTGPDDMKNISLWGIPLLPSKGHEGTDLILLKFLKAQEFKVPHALQMLKKTLRWRKEFGVDGLLDEELGLDHLNYVAYMDRKDKDGRLVLYDNYGVFKDRNLYMQTFGDDQRCRRFLQWKVQFMENEIKQMTLKPSDLNNAGLVQIIDLKDSLKPGMKELRTSLNKVVSVLQQNYPEFIEKTIVINVTFRYYVYHLLFSPFMTPWRKNKFLLLRPSKVTEKLLKYIAPQDLPVQFGGLKREDDDEFSAENEKVSELVIKRGGKGTIEVPVTEAGVTVVWDITVVGWDVSYKEEFIPDDQGSYKVLIKQEKKLHESWRNSFYISEPGKVVLTIENRSLKKKKRVFYRSKSRHTVPLHKLLNRFQ